MKSRLFLNVFLGVVLLVGSVSYTMAQSGLKVGDNNRNLDSKSALEVESITKGFLPPRMTVVQIRAITTPPAGLIIYCIDCSCSNRSLATYDGSNWRDADFNILRTTLEQIGLEADNPNVVPSVVYCSST